MGLLTMGFLPMGFCPTGLLTVSLFSQTLTPSEWWSYFSLLVVSEEYTLDNIYGKNCVSGYIMYYFRAQTSQK